jgi:dihydropyrimidinase
MVFDFRLPDARLFKAMQVMARHGGMLQVHCEDPVLLDAAVADALQRGDVLPRYHATTRPPFVEAVATARALAFARQAEAPVHVVHLSSAMALEEVRRAKAAGVRVSAETCPHYLTFTDTVYDEPDAVRCAAYVISPPLRAAADRDALWAGLADGSLDLVATDHVPDRMAVEKGDAARGVPFNEISNGAPGIETLLAVLYGRGVATGRITLERMVDLIATTPARRFGLTAKGALEIGKDADVVLFDPGASRTIRAGHLHHTSDYTPYEGMEVAGAVRSVFVRGAAVIRDGAFVGQRGFGRFIERGPIEA